jgi:hypothetical protein
MVHEVPMIPNSATANAMDVTLGWARTRMMDTAHMHMANERIAQMVTAIVASRTRAAERGCECSVRCRCSCL